MDQYEEQREQPTAPVRKVEAEERMWRLMAGGATLNEIQQAEDLVSKIREEREATRQSHLLAGQRAVFWKAIQRCEQKANGRRRKSLPK